MAAITARATGDNVSIASGSFTGAGAAQQIILGFSPRYIRVVNETDAIVWTKMDSSPAANSVKVVTAGTTTVDTGSAILIDLDAGLAETGSGLSFTLSSGLCVSAKVISWMAMG